MAPAAPAAETFTAGPAAIAGPGAAEQLASARLYLCTDARERQGDLEEFLDEVLAAGVDIVQLRQKGLEARAELSALEVFADACARHGKLFAVNDRADLAFAAGAPVLHLGQDDLPVATARRIVGPATLLGRSTHEESQVDTALAELAAHGPGYFCVGPCWPTPTKPGRPAPGLGLVGYAAALARAAAGSGTGFPPWFAIGGIDLSTLGEVLAAGARRIVVVRAITEAEDPAAATRELLRRLGLGR